MICPGCGAETMPLRLEGHSGTRLDIDLCSQCHAFWFDGYESLQLSPASTLALFTKIGELASTSRGQIGRVLRCPRCQGRLTLAHDRQRDTAFQYWRCGTGHGRFITFFNFLREKSFIRPLSAAELTELRQNVQTVNCSNCGGPIDLSRGTECPHCGSALSMLDMKQAERVVAQLRNAAAPKPLDPALPLNLVRARQEAEQAFALADLSDSWWEDASSTGLVEAGVAAIARWLKTS